MNKGRAYIYENGDQLLTTNDPADGKGMKLLWQGYADSPEEALQQFDPEGSWKARPMGTS